MNISEKLKKVANFSNEGEKVPTSACGSACGAADPKKEEAPASACGSACGAADPEKR